MIDAVRTALDMLDAAPKGERKLIVVFSDGIDVDMDARTFTSIGKRAQDAGIVIDTIGYAPFEPGKLRNLGSLAKQSNGIGAHLQDGGRHLATTSTTSSTRSRSSTWSTFEVPLAGGDGKDHVFQVDRRPTTGASSYSNDADRQAAASATHLVVKKGETGTRWWLWMLIGARRRRARRAHRLADLPREAGRDARGASRRPRRWSAPAPAGPMKTMALDVNVSGGAPAVGWIVATSGKHADQTFKLKPARTLIGTGGDCDVKVEDQFMSSHHCEVRFENGSSSSSISARPTASSSTTRRCASTSSSTTICSGSDAPSSSSSRSRSMLLAAQPVSLASLPPWGAAGDRRWRRALRRALAGRGGGAQEASRARRPCRNCGRVMLAAWTALQVLRHGGEREARRARVRVGAAGRADDQPRSRRDHHRLGGGQHGAAHRHRRVAQARRHQARRRRLTSWPISARPTACTSTARRWRAASSRSATSSASARPRLYSGSDSERRARGRQALVSRRQRPRRIGRHRAGGRVPRPRRRLRRAHRRRDGLAQELQDLASPAGAGSSRTSARRTAPSSTRCASRSRRSTTPTWCAAGRLQVRFVETADAVAQPAASNKPRTMSIPAQGGGSVQVDPALQNAFGNARRRAQPGGADAAEGLRAAAGGAGARHAGGAAARGVAGARGGAASQRGQPGRAAAAARGEPRPIAIGWRDAAREVAAGRRDPRADQGRQRAARRARGAQGRAPDATSSASRSSPTRCRRASGSSSARTRTCSAPSR